jgi:general stress protein CsbA
LRQNAVSFEIVSVVIFTLTIAFNSYVELLLDRFLVLCAMWENIIHVISFGRSSGLYEYVGR